MVDVDCYWCGTKHGPFGVGETGLIGPVGPETCFKCEYFQIWLDEKKLMCERLQAHQFFIKTIHTCKCKTLFH